MPNISEIKIGNTTYKVKDEETRTEVSDLRSAISDGQGNIISSADLKNSVIPNLEWYDIIGKIDPNGSSARGVTLSRDDNGELQISGTAGSSGAAVLNLFYDKTSFPSGIEPGKTYRLFAKSNVFRVRVIYYTSASDNGTALYDGLGHFINKLINIPANATGITFRLQATVTSGVDYSESGIRLCFCSINDFSDEVVRAAIGSKNGNDQNTVTNEWFDILGKLNVEPTTTNGVTFSKDDNGEFRLNGTAAETGVIIFNVFYNRTAFPDGITAGKKYRLFAKSNAFLVKAIYYTSAEDNGTAVCSVAGRFIDQIFEIPENATGISFRLQTAAVEGTDYSETGIRVCCCSYNEFSNDVIHASTQSRAGDDGNIVTNEWFDILGKLNVEPTTTNGVTFSKDDNGEFLLSGTATESAGIIFNIYYNRIAFPTGIEAGKTYRLFGKSKRFHVRVISYTSEEDSGTALCSETGDFINQVITIPSNATGVTVRLHLYSGVAGTDYSESGIQVCLCAQNDFSDQVIQSYSRSGNGNENAKIWCIGNSFMNGAVWTNNSYDHLVGYPDSIYGQVAVALGIEPANNDHVMYSSTGLMAAGEYGSFLSIITGTNITPYDFLMTQFNGTDIDTFSLGTVNATDNDGTLAGAVVHLVNYIKENNGLCKLILLGTPPYSADPSKSGQYVFTGNWRQGYNINDLDNVMYALAKKYHFIYISWQDLEISYHYMDYADYTAGQTNARHAKDDRVYRVLGQYVGNQIKAVNSPIAIGKMTT